MTPRYQWTPASEPPDDTRSVIVWMDSIEGWCEGFFRRGQWYTSGFTGARVTHWRDVEPPTEGKG